VEIDGIYFQQQLTFKVTHSNFYNTILADKSLFLHIFSKMILFPNKKNSGNIFVEFFLRRKFQ